MAVLLIERLKIVFQ